MNWKTKRVELPLYSLVASGGMASPNIGEGRLIPALIIDNEGDERITEWIQLHKGMPPGDTGMQWALPKTFFAPKHVYLTLDVMRPMEIKFAINFNLLDNYSVVDGIIQSRAFYLMTGKASDKVSQKINDSILIEVPNINFDKEWDKMLVDTIKKKYRNQGVSRKDVRPLSVEHIKSMRDVWRLRRQEEG